MITFARQEACAPRQSSEHVVPTCRGLKKRAPAGCQRATRRTNAGNVTGLAGSELQEPYTRYAINALSGASTLPSRTTYVVEILLEDSGNPVDNLVGILAATW
jgi:hypothetical protein